MDSMKTVQIQDDAVYVLLRVYAHEKSMKSSILPPTMSRAAGLFNIS